MRTAAGAFAVLLLSCACSTPGAPSAAAASPWLPSARAASLSTPIRHVVVIVQENRSFDNLFAGFPGADAPTTGRTHDGRTVPLHPIALEQGTDIAHMWSDALNDYNGGAMNGFDRTTITGGQPAQEFPYAYVEHSEIGPYWQLARTYTLADRFFPTMFGGSFTAHLDLIATTTDLSPSSSEVDMPSAEPWGCDAPGGTVSALLDTKRVTNETGGPFPCFSQFRTLADTLDAAKVSWRYYAAEGTWIWSPFDAIRRVRTGADWHANIGTPQTSVLSDIANGKLPAVAWVTPDWADSDHAGGQNTGPSWVASVVNAIGNSRYWNSTAIVVVWDDWGGWYDDARPPQLDYRGLGIRVPCIVVSPYAKRGYVSHTQYEYGSIAKLIEQIFGLPALGTTAEGYTDARANSMLDTLDFSRPPHRFSRVDAPHDEEFFMHRSPSRRLPDDE